MALAQPQTRRMPMALTPLQARRMPMALTPLRARHIVVQGGVQGADIALGGAGLGVELFALALQLPVPLRGLDDVVRLAALAAVFVAAVAEGHGLGEGLDLGLGGVGLHLALAQLRGDLVALPGADLEPGALHFHVHLDLLLGFLELHHVVVHHGGLALLVGPGQLGGGGGGLQVGVLISECGLVFSRVVHCSVRRSSSSSFLPLFTSSVPPRARAAALVVWIWNSAADQLLHLGGVATSQGELLFGARLFFVARLFHRGACGAGREGAGGRGRAGRGLGMPNGENYLALFSSVPRPIDGRGGLPPRRQLNRVGLGGLVLSWRGAAERPQKGPRTIS